MKVLNISSYGALGGAELALAQLLAHRPQDVDASSVLLVEDGPIRPRLEALGVTVWTGGEHYDGRPGPAQMIRFSRSLAGLLERVSPDVVLATGLKAAVMAVGACRAKRVPIVWHKVDFSLDSVVALPLAAAVTGVVSVSDAVAESLGPLRRRRLLKVLGTPVGLPVELHIKPNETPTIGTAATLTPIKGQHHIIEAAGLLTEEFPELRVVLAGAPSTDFPEYPDELRRLAASVGISESLEMTGFVDDVTDVLRKLTVFVSSTYQAERHFGREGLGKSILEASWVGLPVVVTRGGGSAEALVDRVTGTLVQPADPADIARAVGRYLRDPGLAQSSGEAGRSFTREHFTPEIFATRVFEALRIVAR